MERAKLELMVGVFVLVGIACLGYLSIKLGKLEVIGGHNYPVEAEFTSASGLKPGASVEIAGVEVGRVRHIGLSSDRALVASGHSRRREVVFRYDRLHQDPRDYR
jgi:phospholipid/cholesterol/gamma-HCH transport system substrate-binding protein